MSHSNQIPWENRIRALPEVTTELVGETVLKLMRQLQSDLAAYGLGVGLGLLAMGFAAQSILWQGYMRANPEVGSISTTPGFTLFYAGIFVLGSVIAYTSFVTGLAVAVDSVSTE